MFMHYAVFLEPGIIRQHVVTYNSNITIQFGLTFAAINENTLLLFKVTFQNGTVLITDGGKLQTWLQK